jgi:hypothetical protein
MSTEVDYNCLELRIGELIGDTNRITIASTYLRGGPGTDIYATHIAIAADHDQYHKYAVWDVYARPEGFAASNGEYFHSLEKAFYNYVSRGGQ